MLLSWVSEKRGQDQGSLASAVSGLCSRVRLRDNQREDRPDIRVDRLKRDRRPVVFAVQRPSNTSVIYGLKEFAFPRWPRCASGSSRWKEREGQGR